MTLWPALDRTVSQPATIASGFSHPNCAAVFDLEASNGKIQVATELVAGASLWEVARACHELNQQTPLGLIVRAIHDAALGLHYAHTFTDTLGRPRHIVHAALSDRNLWVAFDGTTKVFGFGVGDVTGESRTYASPEKLKNEALDARADIFSLAAVFHAVATSSGLRYGEVLGRSPTPAVSAVYPEADAQLDAAIDRAVHSNRDSRHMTALAFARELEHVAGSVMFTADQAAGFVQRMFVSRLDRIRALADTADSEDSMPTLVEPLQAEAESLKAEETIRDQASTGVLGVPRHRDFEHTQALKSSGSLAAVLPDDPFDDDDDLKAAPTSKRRKAKRSRGVLAALVGLLGVSAMAAWFVSPNWLPEQVGRWFGKSAAAPEPAAEAPAPPADPEPKVEPEATVAFQTQDAQALDAGTSATTEAVVLKAERPTRRVLKSDVRAKKKRRR